MTNAYSKLLTPVAITCKEFNHPWTNHCSNATAGLLLAATPYCLRVYTMVYALSLVMRQRIPKRQDILRTIQGILRSTAFLVTNSYTFILYNCLLRYVFGCYYQATVSFLPSFLASWTAILIERPARRPLLTLYVANVATETWWNMAVSRGWVRSVPHGQTLIFGASISILLYLFRLGLHKSTCKDQLFDILRIFVGKGEEGPVKTPHAAAIDAQNAPAAADGNRSGSSSSSTRHRQPINVHSIAGLVAIYGRFTDALKCKHSSCPHSGACLKYALLGGLKPFVGGVSLQVALKILMNITKIVQSKMEWRKNIFNKNTLNLGIFLGSFSLLYKFVSCVLRHSFGFDDARFAIPAGLIGSIAFTKYPDITVALYLMWKMLQIIYNLGIEHGKLPRVPGFLYFFYSLCTATLFHAGVLEPKCLRPSYFKFLQAISGERLSKFNLEAFDVYGHETSRNAKEVMQNLRVFNHSELPKFALAD